MNEGRNWGSVRTVLEGLILAALLWTGNGLMGMKVQIATLQTQLTSLQTSLANVAELSTRVARLEQTAQTNAERIRALEAKR